MMPYKCPNCEGSGELELKSKSGNMVTNIRCHSCDGKGIIWSGPETMPAPYPYHYPYYGPQRNPLDPPWFVHCGRPMA